MHQPIDQKPFLLLPLRSRTLILRYPLQPLLGKELCWCWHMLPSTGVVDCSRLHHIETSTWPLAGPIAETSISQFNLKVVQLPFRASKRQVKHFPKWSIFVSEPISTTWANNQEHFLQLTIIQLPCGASKRQLKHFPKWSILQVNLFLQPEPFTKNISPS